MKLINISLLVIIGAGLASASVLAEENIDLPDGVKLPKGFNLDDYKINRGLKIVEESIEAESLRISMNADTKTGFVLGRVCDQCEEIKVNITPETRAYANGKEVALSQAEDRIGREAIVHFDVETKNVTRIRW